MALELHVRSDDGLAGLEMARVVRSYWITDMFEGKHNRFCCRLDVEYEKRSQDIWPE